MMHSIEYSTSLGVMETKRQDEDFAMRLKRLRLNAKLKQSEIAQKLGLSQPGYSKYENSDYKIIPRNFSMLAKILGVTSEYLLHGHEVDDKGLINMLSKKFKERTTLSQYLTQDQILNNDLNGDDALILKAGNSKDYEGKLFTFELNNRRFSPKYLLGDKITFNSTLKPTSGVDILYLYEDSLLIGTYTKTRDGYKIEALNNLCEELYSVDIIGVIVQVVKAI